MDLFLNFCWFQFHPFVASSTHFASYLEHHKIACIRMRSYYDGASWQVCMISTTRLSCKIHIFWHVIAFYHLSTDRVLWFDWNCTKTFQLHNTTIAHFAQTSWMLYCRLLDRAKLSCVLSLSKTAPLLMWVCKVWSLLCGILIL